MKYLLDTNVCIKFINGDSESVKLKLQGYRPEDILLCSVVKSELIYGVLKSKSKTKNMEKLNLFFNPFESLSFDDNCAAIPLAEVLYTTDILCNKKIPPAGRIKSILIP